MRLSFAMRLSGVRWCPAVLALLVVCGGLELEAQSNSLSQVEAGGGSGMSEGRLKWRLETTVEAYKTWGHTNSAWDQAAIRALTEMALNPKGSPGFNENLSLIEGRYCKEAMDAGCDDPMIRYMSLLSVNKGMSKEELVTALCKVAQDMDASFYPPIRKFYVWCWFNSAINAAYGYGDKIPKDLLKFQPWDRAQPYLIITLKGGKIPPQDAYDACGLFLALWAKDKTHYPIVFDRLEKSFPESWKDEPIILLLKGETFIDMAWLARGNGYANTVSNEGWELFGERLTIAERTLRRAWELDPQNPQIACRMMKVALGQGWDRSHMELWFNRAMALDANCYNACCIKLNYLDPKWNGSIKEMLEFGHQCVSNKNWGGDVPLIMVDALSTVRSEYADEAMKFDYWKIPEVWADVKGAYDRFFEVNPKKTKVYNNYAWHAYQAERWQDLNAIIPKIDPVDYKFFGGKDRFDAMVAEARQHGDARLR